MDRLFRLALGDLPGCVRVEQDEVGRGTPGQPPGVEAQDPRRRLGHGAQQGQQAELALVHQPQAHRQHGLHADHAAGGLGEGQPLAVLVLRAMVAGDHVDRAVAQRLDHGAPVVLGAQRRRDLGEGPVALDLELVEREVVRGRVAGDPQAARLGGADRGQRPGGRDVREVQPAAGELDQAQVALDHHRLGRRRDPGQAEARGELPLVHHAVLGQRRLLGMLDDQGVEAGGVGQGAAHHPRVGQRPLAVGEGHRARRP